MVRPAAAPPRPSEREEEDAEMDDGEGAAVAKLKKH
jgi:hypothetical protein